MIDKNNVLVLQCIMTMNKCDLVSAIKFAEHNQTCYNLAMAVAQAKDNEPVGEQPIMEAGGWHTEQPTEDGWYLVDTPDFPKNCECVVTEWDNDAKNFYDESSDYPIKFRRWKLIERR